MAGEDGPATPDSTTEASAAGDKRPSGESPELSRDSLLDLFKNMDVEENSVSLLSRNLADVNIHSLLEQSRRIARQIRAR